MQGGGSSMGGVRRGLSYGAVGVCLALICGAAPGQPRREEVEMVAVGDICLARGVEREAARSHRGYPFTRIAGTLRAADVAFGNLECVLSRRGTAVPKRYNFRASPSWAKRLREAGFDVLSLANNHTLDYGRAGLADTVNAVTKAGIVPVGAGKTPEEAHAPRVLRIGSLRIGFLAYLGMFPSILPLIPRAPWVAMGYPESIRRDVRAAMRSADVLVVSLHAGVEMDPQPSIRQRALCHAAADAGAHLVLGHHPHRVQPVERYRQSVIFYSLGNFVFDPSRAVRREPSGPWGGAAVVRLTRGRVSRASLLPLLIADRQPRIARDGSPPRGSLHE